MKIKELIIDEENQDSGVYAISFVSAPATEIDFIHFKEDIKLGRRKDKADEAGVDLTKFWKYTAEPFPETIETSHPFCKKKAGNVYHVDEINGWQQLSKRDAFIDGSNYFASFNVGVANKNIDQQIYGCRHHFKQVTSVSEIPEWKLKAFSKEKKIKSNFSTEMVFKITNKEKREVEGVAMTSGKFIYRNDIGDGNEGYVYFSRETIRKIKEKYGYNRSITIEHAENITGTAILLDSWLDEDDEKNITEWSVRYKIIDEGLWDAVKLGLVRGYSIEGAFDTK